MQSYSDNNSYEKLTLIGTLNYMSTSQAINDWCYLDTNAQEHIPFPTMCLQYVCMHFLQPSVWHSCCGYLVSRMYFTFCPSPWTGIHGSGFHPTDEWYELGTSLWLATHTCFLCWGEGNQHFCNIATKFQLAHQRVHSCELCICKRHIHLNKCQHKGEDPQLPVLV